MMKEERGIKFRARKINVVLFDVQIEVILKSLELYCYDTNKKYNYRKLSINKDENLEKSLIRDTYHQLLACKNGDNTKIS